MLTNGLDGVMTMACARSSASRKPALGFALAAPWNVTPWNFGLHCRRTK